MGTFLLTTWDGAGNFPPERALVRALVARGHDVAVLAFDAQADAVKADGARFLPLEGVIQYASSDPRHERDRSWVIQNVVLAEGYGASLAKAVAKTAPDVLLVDFVLVAALQAGVASGIPTVALGHTIYTPFRASPLGPAVEASRLIAIFSYRALDPAETFSAHVRFFAPYSSAPPPRLDTPARKRPSIVVSLSTSFQDQAALIQKLCDAMRHLDADVLVTTGYAFPAGDFERGDNTAIQRFAPHDEILPRTDLLITHAGHGTVMAGARHGVPMLCLPMGRDQPFVAAQAQRLGLCHVGEPGAAVATLRTAIADALADHDMRKRARDFAASVAGTPDIDAAAAEVEALAGR